MYDLIPEPKWLAVQSGLMSAFGTAELESVFTLSGGLSGAGLYRVRVGGITYVLRIEPPVNAFNDPVRGYICMRTAAEAALAPRVRYADPSDGVAIIDYLPPRSMVHDYPGDGKALIVELAQAVRLLHQTPSFPPLVDYLDGMRALLAQHRASGILDVSVTEAVIAAFDRVCTVYRTRDLDLVSSHNDLNPGNVLYDGKRLWFVDWDAAFLADRYVDLAGVAGWFTSDKAGEDLLLRTYFRAEPDAEQRARFDLMRLVNHIFYGLIMLNGAAAERPGARPANRDLAGPTLDQLAQRLREGDLTLQAWDDRVTYGKARLAAALAGMQGQAFEHALQLVTN